MKQEHQQKILAVTKMDAIPFVTAGVAADTEGHVISEDGMIAIAEALEAAEANAEAAERVAQLESELVTANDAKLDAQNQLEEANATIQTLQAEVARLKDAPAAPAAGSNPAGSDDDAAGDDVVDASAMDFQKELYRKL